MTPVAAHATPTVTAPKDALRVAGVTRRYASVVACDAVDLTLAPGEILGLLGENGAGKSTLLSIIAGMTEPEAGTIHVAGQALATGSPADAIRLGIGTVFQHFSLVPTFTLTEQMRLSGGDRFQATGLLADIDPRVPVGSLSPGERQRIEIAQVISRQPRLLLLDEPTSILSPGEAERVFALLRSLAGSGTAVVLVSHRLREVLDIADRIVVMRHGRTMDNVTAESDPAPRWPDDIERRLLRDMFGDLDDVERPVVPPIGETPATDDVASVAVGMAVSAPGTAVAGLAGPRTGAETLFTVRDATARRFTGRHRPADITLNIAPGEAVGIVGIDGQGQRDLAEMLAGYLPSDGEIRLDGLMLADAGPAAFARAGVAYLTDDRQGDGGVAGMSVRDNLLLKHQRMGVNQRLGILRRGSVAAGARSLTRVWNITPADPATPFGALSGGNQQKVLLAREISRTPRLLIANNPTHGLDVRTQRRVWDACDAVRLSGGAVIFLSPDITEARAHASRIGVIFRGRLSPLVPVAEVEPSTLARQMVNGW